MTTDEFFTLYAAGERDFSLVDLSDFNANGRDIRNCKFLGAYLFWADLRNADLRNCDFRGAQLYGCQLLGADFRNCDIRVVDLDAVDITGVTFTGATLHGTPRGLH